MIVHVEASLCPAHCGGVSSLPLQFAKRPFSRGNTMASSGHHTGAHAEEVVYV